MSKRQVSLHSGMLVLEDLWSPAESFRVASWDSAKENGPVARTALLFAQSWGWMGQR